MRLLPTAFVCSVAFATSTFAQTPPTQGWPASRPATPANPPAQASQGPAAIPLPPWFAEADVDKKGEVTRAQFLAYRMKSFVDLDTNKDNRLSLEEYVKVAEPPFSVDTPGGPSLEERRNRARAEFQNLDTNRSGFVERAEAEVLVHSEFNTYDTDRDNRLTEPEVRLIVQRAVARQSAERQQIEARRREGLTALNDLIDIHLREADHIDKDHNGKLSQQEYLVLAGPADGKEAEGLLPIDIRRKIIIRKFQEIDTDKDGSLSRVELTAYAVRQFLESDLNKDRFLNEEEGKKSQERETEKVRAFLQTLPPPAAPQQQQPQPQRPAPAPAPAAPRGGQPAPGLPQGTR
jgi:Ca2+-binding EF-hand superfamily protein